MHTRLHHALHCKAERPKTAIPRNHSQIRPALTSRPPHGHIPTKGTYRMTERITELTDRLIRYCAIDSQSDADSPSQPSTAIQLNMANLLVQELADIGATDIRLTDYGTVLATPRHRPRPDHRLSRPYGHRAAVQRQRRQTPRDPGL